MARAYTARANERKWHARNFPYYNKCKFHHVGSCTVKCGNCKRVVYMTRDCKAPIAATNQRAPVVNQKAVVTCYECGRPGHYKSECLKLKNQNCRNQAGNREAQGRAFALGGGEANEDSNVITGMFLLNNHYASILFDSAVDRSFVLTTFSSLVDIIPTTLDISYPVELANGKIIGADTIIRGFTLNLLNHPFNIDLLP
ncbi:putative reverse transcriptase domain-containing protein [Tanacetum coccineum]